MARSYYAEHVNENGDFKYEISVETPQLNYKMYGLDVEKENACLLKTKIRSRHSCSDKYFVYILIDVKRDGIESLIGHCCSCKIGTRVVGCCSHVAVVLWYFSYARYLTTIHAPDHNQHLILLAQINKFITKKYD